MSQALLIVDLQNDFLPGGALAVPAGDEVITPINELAADDRFALTIATRDWHPADHSSFAPQGGPWPAHCVHDTFGAQLNERLDLGRVDVIVDKGIEPARVRLLGVRAARADRAAPVPRDRRGHRRRPGDRLLVVQTARGRSTRGWR